MAFLPQNTSTVNEHIPGRGFIPRLGTLLGERPEEAASGGGAEAAHADSTLNAGGGAEAIGTAIDGAS